MKAHWPLTDIEMRTLLYDLSQVENAHTCPHGRPIIFYAMHCHSWMKGKPAAIAPMGKQAAILLNQKTLQGILLHRVTFCAACH